MTKHEVRPLLLGALLATACSSGGSGATSTSSSSASSASSSASASSSGGTGGAGGSASSSSSTGTGTGGGAGGAGGAATGCAACVTVATVAAGSSPRGLFVDATNVYWTTWGAGEVMQAKLDGSSPIALTTGEDAPMAVYVKNGLVYWVSYSETGVLRSAPVGGGAIVDLSPAVGGIDLLVGTDHIWWTGEPDDIWRAPIGGVGDGGAPDLLTGNTLPGGITADASNLYWVDRYDGIVHRADLDLGNSTSLAIGDEPWDIEVDATNAYWTEHGSSMGGGRVMRAAKADGAGSTALASGQASPAGIAIDAANVYWANTDDGTICKTPLAGGAITVLAGGQQKPDRIAIDGTHVYWANGGGSTIVKVPK